MDFLYKVILDNTVESYLVVFCTILFMLVFKRYLSLYIASLLYIVVKRNWSTIEKKEFVSLIIKPLAWFLTISISVFAIDKLNFPESFKYKVYGHSVEEIVEKTGICIIIIYFFWFVRSLVDFIALIFEQKAKLTKDKADDQLITFFRDFLKVVLAICGVLLIIKAAFNQDVSSVITGLSIVGAAVALAAKESLENLIASFVIFFDKPFFTGDTLKVNNVTGTVEHIGLRSTRIRTQDKTLVTVPNKQMVDSVVDNLSMRTQRRAEIKLDFEPKSPVTNIEALMNGIKDILSKNSQQVEKYSVFLTDFNKNGITITVEYFTIHFTMAEFNALKQNFNLAVKKLVEEQKLELASGGADINIFSGDVNAGAPKSNPII